MTIGCQEWGTILDDGAGRYSWPLEVEDPDGLRCCWATQPWVCSEPVGVVPLPEVDLAVALYVVVGMLWLLSLCRAAGKGESDG